MGLVAGSTSREYWSPPNPQNMRVVPPPPGAVCRHCGADYAPGARFCHLCGDGRDSRAAAQPGPEAENRRYWLGLPAKCRAFLSPWPGLHALRRIDGRDLQGALSDGMAGNSDLAHRMAVGSGGSAAGGHPAEIRR